MEAAVSSQVYAVPDNILQGPWSDPNQNKTAPKESVSTETQPNPEDRPIIIKRVDPISTLADIERIKDALLNTGRYGYRNWMIFTLGLNTGRRAYDLLHLKVSDVFVKGNVVSTLYIREHKTDKVAEVPMTNYIRTELKKYIISLGNVSAKDYLFTGQKGGAMSTSSFDHILYKAISDLGLTINVASHSMRKTFGDYRYKIAKQEIEKHEYEPLDMLQEIYQHDSGKTTLRYLGITGEAKRDFYELCNL